MVDGVELCDEGLYVLKENLREEMDSELVWRCQVTLLPLKNMNYLPLL